MHAYYFVISHTPTIMRISANPFTATTFFPVSSFNILGTKRLSTSVIAKTKNGSNDAVADTKDTGPLEIAI